MHELPLFVLTDLSRPWHRRYGWLVPIHCWMLWPNHRNFDRRWTGNYFRRLL